MLGMPWYAHFFHIPMCVDEVHISNVYRIAYFFGRILMFALWSPSSLVAE